MIPKLALAVVLLIVAVSGIVTWTDGRLGVDGIVVGLLAGVVGGTFAFKVQFGRWWWRS